MKGRKTGGRKRGSRNKRTRQFDEKAREGGKMPLDYALEVMRNTSNKVEVRLDAAKTAMPYLHARRAPEDKQGRTMPPMIYVHPDLEGTE